MTIKELLGAAKLIDEAALAAAERRAATDGTSVLAELIRAGAIDSDRLAAELVARTKLPLVAADDLNIDEDAIRALPFDMARHHLALPLGLDLDARPPRMRVAFANPLDETALREVERASGFRLDPAIAAAGALDAAIARAYATLITRSIPRRAPYAVTASGNVVEPSTRPSHRLLNTSEAQALDLKWRALVELLIQKGVFAAAELDEKLRVLTATET